MSECFTNVLMTSMKSFVQAFAEVLMDALLAEFPCGCPIVVCQGA